MSHPLGEVGDTMQESSFSPHPHRLTSLPASNLLSPGSPETDSTGDPTSSKRGERGEEWLRHYCGELGDRFALACLVNDDPLDVRAVMEADLCREFGLPPERAECLFDLALEVMHLRICGRYHSPVVEVARLIATVTGGLSEPGAN